jgi:hypothetical protein
VDVVPQPQLAVVLLQLPSKLVAVQLPLHVVVLQLQLAAHNELLHVVFDLVHVVAAVKAKAI